MDVIIKYKSQTGSYVVEIEFGIELPSSQRKKGTKMS